LLIVGLSNQRVLVMYWSREKMVIIDDLEYIILHKIKLSYHSQFFMLKTNSVFGRWNSKALLNWYKSLHRAEKWSYTNTLVLAALRNFSRIRYNTKTYIWNDLSLKRAL
jgi:hypothetical protein